MQGDAALCTEEMLVQRHQLRREQAVIAAVKEWWRWVAEVGGRWLGRRCGMEVWGQEDGSRESACGGWSLRWGERWPGRNAWHGGVGAGRRVEGKCVGGWERMWGESVGGGRGWEGGWKTVSRGGRLGAGG